MAEEASGQSDVVDATVFDIKCLAKKFGIPEGLSKRQTKKLIKKYKKEEYKAEWRCVPGSTSRTTFVCSRANVLCSVCGPWPWRSVALEVYGVMLCVLVSLGKPREREKRRRRRERSTMKVPPP